MDEEHTLPCAQALLAGTLALMTAYAGSDEGGPSRRELLARKIVSNLFFLRAHPRIDERLRRVLDTVHAHWQVLAGAAVPGCRQALAARGRLH